MSAPWLIVLSTFLFATMGVCVKLASAHYGPGEVVFCRGLVGVVLVWLYSRHVGSSVRTTLPAMHFWRSVTGVTSLGLWFYAIAHLPLATAMTLNYTSSVWMALFLVGGSVLLGASRVDVRLVATVLVGFAGVAMILRPTLEQDQLWQGLVGLLSGMLSALAYLQVTALGRAGEPDHRVVFYFSITATVAGAGAVLWNGVTPHLDPVGIALMFAVGALATVAQILLTRAYRTGRVLVNASLQYLGIAWAFVYGVLLFDDAVSALALGGMLLIVGAGLAATLLRREVASNNRPSSES